MPEASYYPYTTYDTSEGHPFDIGLYHHWIDGVQQTDAEVSVPPLFNDYYEYSECEWSLPIPQDVWAKFHALSSGFWCKLRKDWLVANGEDVVFTDPMTTVDYPRYDPDTETTYPLIDIRVPLTFHDLVTSLDDSPYQADWIWWVRDELNLDKPDGTNRPSHWLAETTSSQSGTDNNDWSMAGAGSAFVRKLASRQPYRIERFAAHLWTGLPGADNQEVDDLYPIYTRANYDAGLDDPKWWTAVCGWSPTGTYSEGRIDTYEGVDCSGTCDEFTQRFFNQKFSAGFAGDWFQSTLGAQMASLPDYVYFHWASEGDPLPGDMLVLEDTWSAATYHVGICHEVDGELIYMAHSNLYEDGLGDFGEVGDLGLTIVGWFRYQVGVAVEDVNDWRGLSCMEMAFSGATEDIGITLNLTYCTLDGRNPHYTGAEWKFGAEGEATAQWSAEKTATREGVLDSLTGIVKWDLGPDSGDAPLELRWVKKVELVFDRACELTYLSWVTVPYDAAHPQNEVDCTRIACKHSTDYFGSRIFVDGMPNYKPDYLYTMDSERVEVGFKHTQDLQHDPDYEGPADDLRYLKTLDAWCYEQMLGQTLMTPHFTQANIDRDLKDVDGASLGVPVYGDYDEDGFALHVGLSLDTFFPVTHIYCDYILQGGVRGILKTNGVRQVDVDDAVSLYGSIDNGATKTLIRTAHTGYAAEYRTGAGYEKAPWKYWLDDQALGSFVNIEEVWAGTFIPGIGMVHMAKHPVSGAIMVTDCSLTANIGQSLIFGGTEWDLRTEVDATPGNQTACTITNVSRGHILLFGDGQDCYVKPQTSLGGEWGTTQELGVGNGIAWPIATNHNGFAAFAGTDNTSRAVFLRFAMTDGFVQVNPQTGVVVASGANYCAPGLCSLESPWRLAMSVSVDGGIDVYSSNDTGNTWFLQDRVAGAGTHHSLCGTGNDLYMVSYHPETYLGAQGCAKVNHISAVGDTWVAGDVLMQLPCDEGRPAIYHDAVRGDLIVLVPKVQAWGIAGTSPAIVEYRSKDKGLTWSDPTVHGVG